MLQLHYIFNNIRGKISRYCYWLRGFFCVIAQCTNSAVKVTKTRAVPESESGIYFLFYYLGSPQGQGHHNTMCQILWARITSPTLSIFPVPGNWSHRLYILPDVLLREISVTIFL